MPITIELTKLKIGDIQISRDEEGLPVLRVAFVRTDESEEWHLPGRVEVGKENVPSEVGLKGVAFYRAVKDWLTAEFL